MARIKEGIQDKLLLGNLDAKRDWGYAPEYCEGMWKILQQDEPEDFVLATGKQHSVREFVELSFKQLDIDLVWEGEDAKEQGIDTLSGKTIVEVDPKYYRPTEVDSLLGDPSKAKEILGWEASTPLIEIVKKMVHADWEKVKRKGY